MKNQTLVRLEHKEIGKRQAYRELYPKPEKIRQPKRAHFVRLRFRIPESKGATAFLGFLFLLPTPLVFVRIVLGFVKFDKEDVPFTKNELMRLIAVRGLKVDIRSNDGVHIFIKTL